MKKIIRVLFACLIASLLPNYGFAQPKLKSATISFMTPANTDNKDWDTQLTVSLYLFDGTLVGTSAYNSCNVNTPPADVKNCFCCIIPLYDSHGKLIDPKTMFVDNGSTRGPFIINIPNPVEKQNIKTGYFEISMKANGNDRWIFSPSLILNFDDGTNATFSNYSNRVISQDASVTTLVFH